MTDWVIRFVMIANWTEHCNIQDDGMIMLFHWFSNTAFTSIVTTFLVSTMRIKTRFNLITRVAFTSTMKATLIVSDQLGKA